MDVSPSVCVNEAKLGSLEALRRCVKLARVLKPTRHAAVELLQLLRLEGEGGGDAHSGACAIEEMDTATLAEALLKASGASLVSLTAGSAGSALAIPEHCVVSGACSIPEAVDATGAGDAFLGGLLAGLYHRAAEIDKGKEQQPKGDSWNLMIPTSRDELMDLACLANAAGAACCENLGGLPRPGAKVRVMQLRGGGSKPTGDAVQEMDTFRKSLAMDAVTLAHMMRDECDLYGSNGASSASRVVEAVLACRGRVHVTGIGKSGIIGRRLAASLASTGTPAHWTHASEWAHGDLGNAAVGHCSSASMNGDLVIALSHSGMTLEVISACRHLKLRGLPIFSITSCKSGGTVSPLEQLSDAALTYSLPTEGALAVEDPLGGTPTCSVIAQEALSNALVCELIERRRFTGAAFKTNHPGGALGRAAVSIQESSSQGRVSHLEPFGASQDGSDSTRTT